MSTEIGRTTPAPISADLSTFVASYSATLRRVYREQADAEEMHLRGGMPPSVLREILAHRPLSTFMPEDFGGRGGHVHEVFAVVEATGYESLALALTLGINGALFLQPVAKYGRDEIKGPISERFLEHQNMGGLMITEPGYGSDALSMETSFSQDADGKGYRIQGVKHWGGLTGLADYWLLTARSRTESGRLGRDVDFFVSDTHRPEQAPVVEERFDNLGLHPIPYGRSRLDLVVPEEHRLIPRTTGLKMLLDVLHRSRLQFPGMAMGYLRRLLDEAVAHVRQRPVGGKMLVEYDQVQRRLADLQAAVTSCNAMCLYSSENALLGMDLSKHGVAANAVKAVITDYMQEAAQSLLQLVGAKGYRLSHVAGRSIVDSRPFMIFEGSNDILYEQLAQGIVKLARKSEHASLYRFLGTYDLTARAADYFKRTADFSLDESLPQRKVVDLGRALGRIITMELVIELGDRGFDSKLVASCLEQTRHDVDALLGSFHGEHEAPRLEEPDAMGSWLGFVNLEAH